MSDIKQVKFSAFRHKNTRHVSENRRRGSVVEDTLTNGVFAKPDLVPLETEAIQTDSDKVDLDNNNNINSDNNNNNVLETLNDGISELTKNSKYCVSKLPAVPHVLRHGEDVFEGIVDQRSTSALIQAPRGIFLWNYLSPDHSPNTLVFDNPIYQRRLQESDADIRNGYEDDGDLLAVLVKPSSGSSEPGLFMIESRSGRSTFWESAGGAVADGLLHKRKGLHHIVALHQEEIENIQNVEPAGLVLTTSIGRFILVTLRDEYGKPSIVSHAMRPGGSGLFATISGAIKFGPSQRGIVSVKRGRRVGQTECQALFINSSFDISIWEVSRTGKSRAIIYEHLRETLLKQIEGLYPDARSSLVAHDLELHPEQSFLFILASFVDDGSIYYIVYTLKVNEDETTGNNPFTVFSAHRLQSYSYPSTQPPRILLPAPYNTLYMVFSGAVVLLDSLPIQLESGTLTRWEDCVSLQNDIEIVGSGPEDIKQLHGRKILRHAGVVLLAKNYGVIRIERFPETRSSQRELLVVDESQDPLPVQKNIAVSKIEQAVFYGEQANNPIDFEVTQERLKFKPEALEQAAVQVSHDILTTRSSYIPPMFPSLNEHLNLRVTFLGRLASYLRASFLDSLSIDSKYELLWDFERASSSKALWSYADSQLAFKAPVNSVLEVVLRTSQTSRTAKSQDSVQDIAVRDWFLYRTDKIDELLVSLGEFAQQNSSSYDVVLDVNNALLRAVFASALEVREQHLSKVYGLDPQVDLSSSCPWTCQKTMVDLFESQYNISVGLLNSSEAQTTAGTKEFSEQLVIIVNCLCYLYTDRIKWLSHKHETSAVTSHNILRELDTLNSTYKSRQREWLQFLVKVGQSPNAIIIAQRFRIYRSLAEILGEEFRVVKSTGPNVLGSTAASKELEISQKLKAYAAKFGYDFCKVLFQYWVDTKQLKLLLTEMLPEYKEFLDTFLASSDAHNKYAWIQHVSEGRFADAASTLTADALLDNGDSTENKKLELSIAKLCAIAEDNKEPEVKVDEGDVMDVDYANSQEQLINKISAKLEHVKIQESLKNQILTDSDPCRDLIKRNARVLVEVVQRSLTRLKQSKTLSAVELIDLLTLIPSESLGESQLNFYRALQVVKNATVDDSTKRLLEQLIWTRLFLATDWARACGKTHMSDADMQKASEQTVLYKTLLLAVQNAGSTQSVLSDYSINLLSTDPVKVTCTELNGQLLRAHVYPYLDQGQFEALKEELAHARSLLEKYESQYHISNWIKGVFVRVQI